MDYAKLVIVAVALLFAGPAFAVDVEWFDISCPSCGSVSSPNPGSILKATATTGAGNGSETTAVINRSACGGYSSFSTDITGGPGGDTILADVQTCKEPSGSAKGCEDDGDAGTVSVGKYAYIGQGTYVRLDWTLGTTGDLLYFDCVQPVK